LKEFIFLSQLYFASQQHFQSTADYSKSFLFVSNFVGNFLHAEQRACTELLLLLGNCQLATCLLERETGRKRVSPLSKMGEPAAKTGIEALRPQELMGRSPATSTRRKPRGAGRA